MRRKKHKTDQRIIFFIFLAVGSILLFTPSSHTGKLQLAFISLFEKPLTLCRNLTHSPRQQPESVVDKRQYLKLRNHLANNIQWLHRERDNIEKLSGLRYSSAWHGADFVLADIITAVTEKTQNELVINRGKEHGLARGLFVSNDHSIVGTVTDLDTRLARVRLITDPRSEVGVKIGQLDSKFVMKGTGFGTAAIRMVPKKYEIKKGDIVYVQKKPGFLEVPMIAGTVTSCRIDDENPLFWNITVTPVYQADEIDNITVILMNSEHQVEDQDNDITT